MKKFEIVACDSIGVSFKISAKNQDKAEDMGWAAFEKFKERLFDIAKIEFSDLVEFEMFSYDKDNLDAYKQ